MKRETVRASAFALPLTNPAFPSGPYRFVNREYFIIQYRTDPDALRRFVPGRRPKIFSPRSDRRWTSPVRRRSAPRSPSSGRPQPTRSLAQRSQSMVAGLPGNRG
jgi:hypothetical protein